LSNPGKAARQKIKYHITAGVSGTNEGVDEWVWAYSQSQALRIVARRVGQRYGRRIFLTDRHIQKAA